MSANTTPAPVLPREHFSAERSNRMLAATTLHAMAAAATGMAAQIEAGQIPYPQDAEGFYHQVSYVVRHLQALDTLRDVARWAQADQAEGGMEERLHRIEVRLGIVEPDYLEADRLERAELAAEEARERSGAERS